MGKGKKITVKDTSIRIVAVEDEDYISLTDMLRAKDGDFFLKLAANSQHGGVSRNLGER